MAITKQKKAEVVADLTEKLNSAKSAVFVNFSGLTVAAASKLRNECRSAGVNYLVAKKSLMKIACDSAKVAIDPKTFSGEVAIAMSAIDEVIAPKILAAFAKNNEAIKFVGGILDKKMLSREEIINLSKIPSKDELLSKLVGSLNAPISGFVNALAGNLRNLVGVLNAIKDTK